MVVVLYPSLFICDQEILVIVQVDAPLKLDNLGFICFRNRAWISESALPAGQIE